MTPDAKVEFWLRPPEAPSDWSYNSHRYIFPKVQKNQLEIASVKDETQMLTLSFKGADSHFLELSAPIPRCGEHGLFVELTWTPERVTLFLSGKKAPSQVKKRGQGTEFAFIDPV